MSQINSSWSSTQIIKVSVSQMRTPWTEASMLVTLTLQTSSTSSNSSLFHLDSIAQMMASECYTPTKIMNSEVAVPIELSNKYQPNTNWAALLSLCSRKSDKETLPTPTSTNPSYLKIQVFISHAFSLSKYKVLYILRKWDRQRGKTRRRAKEAIANLTSILFSTKSQITWCSECPLVSTRFKLTGPRIPTSKF